jgi:hypothetical protein
VAEPRRETLAGTGVFVLGGEDDLDLRRGTGVTVSDLAAAVGAEVCAEEDFDSFLFDGVFGGRAGGDDWTTYREAYARRSGRALPRVYRVKVTVECEALPDDEAGRWWDERQGRRVTEPKQKP